MLRDPGVSPGSLSCFLYYIFLFCFMILCVSPSFVSPLAAGFEVVDGTDDFVHPGCRTDVVQDVPHVFVGHGAFIQGGAAHRGGVHVFHLFFVFRKGKRPLRLCPAHQAAGTVRRGIIPVCVSFSRADQTAVSHVDGNQQFFALLRGNRAFPQNHVFRVDVIMYGGELFFRIRKNGRIKENFIRRHGSLQYLCEESSSCFCGIKPLPCFCERDLRTKICPFGTAQISAVKTVEFFSGME